MIESTCNLNTDKNQTGNFRVPMLVDDQKIRRDQFKVTSNLLFKIQKLEKTNLEFLKWDQILFQDWYDLTFRYEKHLISELENRQKKLEKFLLQLKYISETSSVSLDRAYIMLKEEEHQFQNGDDFWKELILNLRKQRLTQKASLQEDIFEESESNAGVRSLVDILKPDGSIVEGLSRPSRLMYFYLKDLDYEQLQNHFADDHLGYIRFKEAFQVTMKCADWSFLLTIWNLVSKAYHQKLLSPMPSHMKQFILQVINETSSKVKSQGKQDVMEDSKGTFRKLVRILHPDVLGIVDNQVAADWAQVMWQKVQAANKEKDHGLLKRYELMCLAFFGELEHLTLDEIYQCSLIYAEEYEHLKSTLKNNRNHPAWRFSSRRGFDSLTMRMRKDLNKKIALLEEDVRFLENRIGYFAGTIVDSGYFDLSI